MILGICKCSSSHEHASRAAQREASNARDERSRHKKEIADLQTEIAALTPDASNFYVQEAEQVGNNLVMKVAYPSCKKCEYEGSKVMVFVNFSATDALKWRKIDPHFRKEFKVGEAPSPVARFPSTDDGWNDAITYARNKKVP